MFGTLGKRWEKKWSAAEYSPCMCVADEQNKCHVFHGDFADIEILGECIVCGKGKCIEKKLHINGAKRIQTNLATRMLECGHAPVGLTKIWVHLFVLGTMSFKMNVECYNNACTRTSSFTTCDFVNDGIGEFFDVRQLKAVKCCENPQISLVSVYGKFEPSSTQDGVKAEIKEELDSYIPRKKTRLHYIKQEEVQQITPLNWPMDVQYIPFPIWSDKLNTNLNSMILQQPTFCQKVSICKIENVLHPVDGQHGLFVAPGVFIKKGEQIGVYSGIIEKNKYSDSRYIVPLEETTEYTLDINAEKAGNEFRFINDYKDVQEQPNVQFDPKYSESTGAKYIAVIALRDITAGEELLANYGDQYWKSIRKNSM